MKDMNIAKLTSQDSPLFMAIIQDLFPGTETPVMDYGKVTSRLIFFFEVNEKPQRTVNFPFIMCLVIQSNSAML